MNTTATNLKTASHFIILVYPFRHQLEDLSEAQRREQLRGLEGSWDHWWKRLSHQQLKTAIDDTYFFLPYVRELLFPEAAQLCAADTQDLLLQANRFALSPPSELETRIPRISLRRLTYKPERLALLGPLELVFEDEHESFSAHFDLSWVDVALFPQNAGFLIIKVQILERDVAVKRLNDFLYYIRLIHPPQLDWKLASWKTERDGTIRTYSGIEMVEFLLQGFTNPVSSPLSDFDDFLANTRQHPGTAMYTMSQFGQTYGEVFNLFTYVCLSSKEDRNHAEDSDFVNPDATIKGNVSGESGLFKSPTERILYELATCTDTNDPAYVPDKKYLATLLDQGLIGFWDNWKGLALRDNTVFLGIGESRFTEVSLPHNVESDYFHLYLFTAFQKLRLSMTFGELVRRQIDLSKNLREARRLWDSFLMFQNRYWFAEVTRKAQGVELYKIFQRGLRVLPMYLETQEEVQELQEFYERKFERRNNQLLYFLTLVGLPAGLVVGLFSNALIRVASWHDVFLTAVLMYSAVAGAWLISRYVSRE